MPTKPSLVWHISITLSTHSLLNALKLNIDFHVVNFPKNDTYQTGICSQAGYRTLPRLSRLKLTTVYLLNSKLTRYLCALTYMVCIITRRAPRLVRLHQPTNACSALYTVKLHDKLYGNDKSCLADKPRSTLHCTHSKSTMVVHCCLGIKLLPSLSMQYKGWKLHIYVHFRLIKIGTFGRRSGSCQPWCCQGMVILLQAFPMLSFLCIELLNAITSRVGQLLWQFATGPSLCSVHLLSQLSHEPLLLMLPCFCYDLLHHKHTAQCQCQQTIKLNFRFACSMECVPQSPTRCFFWNGAVLLAGGAAVEGLGGEPLASFQC